LQVCDRTERLTESSVAWLIALALITGFWFSTTWRPQVLAMR
jgi:hypothetical protein